MRRLMAIIAALVVGLLTLTSCGSIDPYNLTTKVGIDRATASCSEAIDVRDALSELKQEEQSTDRDKALSAWGFNSLDDKRLKTVDAKLDAKEKTKDCASSAAPAPTATPSATGSPAPAEWKTIDYSKQKGVKPGHFGRPLDCLKDARKEKREPNARECKAEVLEIVKHDGDILSANLQAFNLLPGQDKLREGTKDSSSKLEKLRSDYAKKLRSDWRLRQKEQPRLATVFDSLKNLRVSRMSGGYWTTSKNSKTGALYQQYVEMDPMENFALEGEDATGVTHTTKLDCRIQPSSRFIIPGFHLKHKVEKPEDRGGDNPPPECVEIPGNGVIDCNPKPGDTSHWEYADDKPQVKASGSGQSKSDKVETTHTGGGGVQESSGTTPGGSETGGQAPGATPAQDTPRDTTPGEGDGQNEGEVPEP